jgi:hypothetical protein
MKATSKLLGSLVCAVAFVLAAGQVSANLIQNPGFETGDLTGWQAFGIGGSSFITVQTPDNGPSAGGTHNAFLDNQAQALGLTLKQVTPVGSAAPGPVSWSFDLKTGGATVGGVFFVQVFCNNSGGGVISGGTGLLGNYTPANWTTYSGSFTAPAGTDHLTIQFMANTGAAVGSTSKMHVDNVVLNAIPEPSTVGLVGLGLISLLGLRRRKV